MVDVVIVRHMTTWRERSTISSAQQDAAMSQRVQVATLDPMALAAFDHDAVFAKATQFTASNDTRFAIGDLDSISQRAFAGLQRSALTRLHAARMPSARNGPNGMGCIVSNRPSRTARKAAVVAAASAAMRIIGPTPAQLALVWLLLQQSTAFLDAPTNVWVLSILRELRR